MGTLEWMRSTRRVAFARSEFAGFRFPPEVITLAVHWYVRYLLSYLDVEELLADAIRTDGGGPEGGADLATRAGTRHSTRCLAAGGGGTRPSRQRDGRGRNRDSARLWAALWVTSMVAAVVLPGQRPTMMPR